MLHNHTLHDSGHIASMEDHPPHRATVALSVHAPSFALGYVPSPDSVYYCASVHTELQVLVGGCPLGAQM